MARLFQYSNNFNIQYVYYISLPYFFYFLSVSFYLPSIFLPNFLCNFSQLLLSNISLFTADFGFFVFCFLFAAFWLGICVEMDVDIIKSRHDKSFPESIM